MPLSMSANEIGDGVALGVCVGVGLRLGLSEGDGVWLADAVARTVLETELLRDCEAVVDALAVGLPVSLTVLVEDGDGLCVAEELCDPLTVLVAEPLADALVVADPLIVLVGDGEGVGVEDTLAVELIV